MIVIEAAIRAPSPQLQVVDDHGHPSAGAAVAGSSVQRAYSRAIQERRNFELRVMYSRGGPDGTSGFHLEAADEEDEDEGQRKAPSSPQQQQRGAGPDSSCQAGRYLLPNAQRPLRAP